MDDDLDFMLCRTADGFLEITEIKRATPKGLFNHDTGREVHYPASHLAQVLGQAMRYVAEVDRNRDAILAKDGEETLKVRCRVVIGRDGDDHQVHALRTLNAHLVQFEIFTFDQLLRIARRAVDMFQGARQAHTSQEDEEPPF